MVLIWWTLPLLRLVQLPAAVVASPCVLETFLEQLDVAFVFPFVTYLQGYRAELQVVGI